MNFHGRVGISPNGATSLHLSFETPQQKKPQNTAKSNFFSVNFKGSRDIRSESKRRNPATHSLHSTTDRSLTQPHTQT